MKPNSDYSSDFCKIRVKYNSSRGMILYVTKEMTVTRSADNSHRPTETTKSNKQITDNSTKAVMNPVYELPFVHRQRSLSTTYTLSQMAHSRLVDFLRVHTLVTSCSADL